MAKKYFRIDAANEKISGFRDNLQSLLTKYIPSQLQAEALNAIESDGQIPDEIFQKAAEAGSFGPQDISAVKNTFLREAQKLPSAKDALTKYLKDTENEQDATDETLQERMDAFKELGNYRAETEASTHIGGDQAGITTKTYGGRSPDAPDTSLDIKRIGDILAARGEDRRKEGAVQNFLAETPAELEASRGRFLAEREDSLGKTLTERTTPQVLQELNTRGLADSPDVISEVARRGAAMQGTIEAQLRDLELQDASFFADAAFRIQTAKLNQKEADLRSTIDLERTRTRSDQEKRFKSSQDQLNSDFEINMLKRDQDRKLRATQEGINFDASERSAASQAADAADIGMSIGRVVGTKIGTRTSGDIVNGTKQNSTIKPDFQR